MNTIKKQITMFYDKPEAIKNILQNWIEFAEEVVRRNQYPKLIIVIPDEPNEPNKKTQTHNFKLEGQS